LNHTIGYEFGHYRRALSAFICVHLRFHSLLLFVWLNKLHIGNQFDFCAGGEIPQGLSSDEG